MTDEEVHPPALRGHVYEFCLILAVILGDGLLTGYSYLKQVSVEPEWVLGYQMLC